MERILWNKPLAKLLLAAALILASEAATANADELSVSEAGIAPLHPTVIMADYKGAGRVVVAVNSEFARVQVDGKLVTLRGKQSYRPALATAFSPGYIKFKDQQSSSTIYTSTVTMFHGGLGGGPSASNASYPEGMVSSSGDYECKVVSSLALPDCFLAVVFFRVGADGNTIPGSVEMAFREIGNLTATTPTAVKISSAYIAPPNTRFYHFPLLFSKGQEVRSDQSEVSARFFRYQDIQAHREFLRQYRMKNPTSDRPAYAYLRYPPILPDGIDPRTLPGTIRATFRVTESGDVDSLVIEPELDPKALNAIRRAVGGWLFLPRLKNGLPIPVQIEAPLSFAAQAP
jgi:hypothetical protein